MVPYFLGGCLSRTNLAGHYNLSDAIPEIHATYPSWQAKLALSINQTGIFLVISPKNNMLLFLGTRPSYISGTTLKFLLVYYDQVDIENHYQCMAYSIYHFISA